MQGANEPGTRAAEVEASRIAKRAAEALRQSRAAVQVRSASLSTASGRRRCTLQPAVVTG